MAADNVNRSADRPPDAIAPTRPDTGKSRDEGTPGSDEMTSPYLRQGDTGGLADPSPVRPPQDSSNMTDKPIVDEGRVLAEVRDEAVPDATVTDPVSYPADEPRTADGSIPAKAEANPAIRVDPEGDLAGTLNDRPPPPDGAPGSSPEQGAHPTGEQMDRQNPLDAIDTSRYLFQFHPEGPNSAELDHPTLNDPEAVRSSAYWAPLDDLLIAEPISPDGMQVPSQSWSELCDDAGLPDGLRQLYDPDARMKLWEQIGQELGLPEKAWGYRTMITVAKASDEVNLLYTPVAPTTTQAMQEDGTLLSETTTGHGKEVNIAGTGFSEASKIGTFEISSLAQKLLSESAAQDPMDGLIHTAYGMGNHEVDHGGDLKDQRYLIGGKVPSYSDHGDLIGEVGLQPKGHGERHGDRSPSPLSTNSLPPLIFQKNTAPNTVLSNASTKWVDTSVKPPNPPTDRTTGTPTEP